MAPICPAKSVTLDRGDLNHARNRIRSDLPDSIDLVTSGILSRSGQGRLIRGER